MNKNKTILASIVLLSVLVVGGLVAFFTDTKSTTNTFTIGSVTITLTEPNWVANNAQNVMPGDVIPKDPTVTNTGNNDAFVFMKVVAPCTTGTGAKELFEYTPNSGWAEITVQNVTSACNAGNATHVYVYGTSSAPQALSKTAPSNVTPALFSNVTVTSLNGDEGGITGNLDMVITAYAIQKDGLGTNPNPVTIFGNFS